MCIACDFPRPSYIFARLLLLVPGDWWRRCGHAHSRGGIIRWYQVAVYDDGRETDLAKSAREIAPACLPRGVCYLVPQ